MQQSGAGALRLGRRCPASTRDLFGVREDRDSHLNAWVFAEVGNGDAERVDRNEFVGNLGFE